MITYRVIFDLIKTDPTTRLALSTEHQGGKHVLIMEIFRDKFAAKLPISRAVSAV